MKYMMELTAAELQVLDETLRIVRKGGDARIVAKSKAGIALARKTQELRTPFVFDKVPRLGRHEDGRHYAEAPREDVRRITTLLPPPSPSTTVVASTTFAGESE